MSKKVVQGKSYSKRQSKADQVTSKSFKNGKITRTTTRLIKNKRGQVTREVTSSRSFDLFGFVFLILIAIVLIGALRVGATQKTFLSFLEMLANVPQVNFDWVSWYTEITLNLPSWLSWLEVLVKVSTGLFTMLGVIVQGIWQAFQFIYHFILWVFVL